MKTLLLTAFLSFSFFQIKAQCTTTVSGFGNNSSTPSYNISGDVSVTLNDNNTVSVNFASNFSTASGPDVRLYLLKSNGKSLSDFKNINPNNEANISFGLIGFSGAQSYTETLPENIDISEYDIVFFYCLQFNAFWDVGSFSAFTSESCSVLDVDSFNIDEISVYPNPAKNKIQIKNTTSFSAEISIFNVLGKQVFYQPKIKEKTIDISSLNRGIYLVKIIADRKSKTQRLIIQ